MAVCPEIEKEKKLWEAFKGGDKAALSAIYKKYIVDLYNYGARITADKDILEDSIQELFFKLWKQRASLTKVSSIKFYLYRGLKNNILDTIKKRGKLQPDNKLPDDFFFDIIPPREEEIIGKEGQIYQQKEMQLAIQQHLTPRQKEAITLMYYDNLSYDEIAVLLSMSTKATYKLIYRALDVLRAHLENIMLVVFFILNFFSIL
jgi:RNA polymerase sigma factor (sigma-70 family)